MEIMVVYSHKNGPMKLKYMSSARLASHTQFTFKSYTKNGRHTSEARDITT